MQGVEGGAPRPSLGDLKGVFSSRREYPLCPTPHGMRGPPYSARGAAKLTHLCQVRKKEHSMDYTMKVIARIHSDFPEKFGIPRQSGLVPALRAKIVFEPEYRNPDALRGIEGFSHLWLIWQFSAAVRDTWSPTVRPPRLGGNERVGVFATRSPFRPNAIGLSCVKLEGVRHEDGLGDVLIVSGADLMDGTPIYDIKPYLPYADAHPEALGGFAPSPKETIEVKSPPELLQKLPEGQREALLGVLAQDPRPQYQNDPVRVYGMSFGGWDVKFRVKDGVLTVLSLAETEHQ